MLSAKLTFVQFAANVWFPPIVLKNYLLQL